MSGLAPGSVVILVSSGAALNGSPVSGGYAGAKRMQMLIANYCQKESDRLGLGIRFLALAPAMIMPGTEFGRHAVEGYARYLGMPIADFAKPTGIVDVKIDAHSGMLPGPYTRKTITEHFVSSAFFRPS